VLVKEIERAGLPTAHICALTPVAHMVGSNRVIPVASILHPVGDPNRDPKAEKALRRGIVEEALKALQHRDNQQ
jgi:glycine reductase complex component B subunit gamma